MLVYLQNKFLDGTGGIIDKAVARSKKRIIWIGAISSNEHLNPIDNEFLIKKMMHNTLNQKSINVILDICNIKFDYRNHTYIPLGKVKICDD